MGEAEVNIGARANKHFHYRGEFCIRTEWQCGTLLYEVFLNSGLIVATGFDMLSLNEEEAVEAILSRRVNGKSKYA